MPSYTAAWPRVFLSGFYDGLSLIALTAGIFPHISQNVANFSSTPGGVLAPFNASFGSVNTAHNAIVVYLCAFSNPGTFLPDAVSVTDTNSNSYTNLGTQQDGIGGANHLSAVFCASDVAGGGNTISINYTYLGAPVNCNIVVIAVEVAGVTTSPVADFQQMRDPGPPTVPVLTVTSASTAFVIAADCELFSLAQANGFVDYAQISNGAPGSIAGGIAVLIRPKQQIPIVFVCT